MALQTGRTTGCVQPAIGLSGFVAVTLSGRPMTWKRTAHRMGPGGRTARFSDPSMVERKKSIAYQVLSLRPAGWPMDRRYALAVRSYGPSPSADVDNLAKLILDALQGVLWTDDKRVDYLSCAKVASVDYRTEIEALIVEPDGERLAACATLGRLAGSQASNQVCVCATCGGIR